MPMIGHGTRVTADIKRGSNMPFSVQANHVFFSHYNQSASAGTNVDYAFNNFKWQDSAGEDRNPMPFGGKILYSKIRMKFTRADVRGYVVPLINGVEAEGQKVAFDDQTGGDILTATTEVSFDAGDYLGYRIKSESGAIAFDEFVVMVVYGFDI